MNMHPSVRIAWGRRGVALLLALICLSAATAFAQNWSYFVPLGNDVSVSFAQVDNTTYTWKFRNDGGDTITYLKFTYSYFDANTGQYQTATDYFPGSLEPGQVFGGWSAFAAVTRLQPTVQIVEIHRQ